VSICKEPYVFPIRLAQDLSQSNCFVSRGVSVELELHEWLILRETAWLEGKHEGISASEAILCFQQKSRWSDKGYTGALKQITEMKLSLLTNYRKL
jgi:hypothetical protein